MRTLRVPLLVPLLLAHLAVPAPAGAAAGTVEMSLFLSYSPGLAQHTVQTVEPWGGSISLGTLVCSSPRGPLTLAFRFAYSYFEFGLAPGQSSGPEGLTGGSAALHSDAGGGTAVVGEVSDPLHDLAETVEVSSVVDLSYARAGTTMAVTLRLSDVRVSAYGLYAATTCPPIEVAAVLTGAPFLDANQWIYYGAGQQVS